MPMIRRRRPVLRAAAVTGGAYAVGKQNARVQADREQRAYETGQLSVAALAPATAPAPRPSGITAEDMARLAELGRLHEQGVLTDEEFAAQKARILGVR